MIPHSYDDNCMACAKLGGLKRKCRMKKPPMTKPVPRRPAMVDEQDSQNPEAPWIKLQMPRERPAVNQNKCGCRIVHAQAALPPGRIIPAHVVYCPLHANAEKMREALERILKESPKKTIYDLAWNALETLTQKGERR